MSWISNHTGIPGRSAWVLLFGIFLPGCLHDIGVPLRNLRPVLADGSPRPIDTVMYYPDSVVCTLLVRDLSDSILSIDSTSWPGSYRQIDFGLQDKRVELLWPSGIIGRQKKGLLRLVDENGESVEVEYKIAKVFSDPLESYPPAAHWAVYQPADSSGYVRLISSAQQNYLEFYFARNSSLRQPRTVTFVSSFGLAGNFSWTLDSYWLKQFVREGDSVRFAVSSSPDPSRYIGDRVEFILSGEGTGLMKSYLGPSNKQTGLTADDSFYSGPLRFERIGNEVHIQRLSTAGVFRDGDVDFLMFGAVGPVYVHISMTVTDFSEDRFLTLHQFTIDQGEIVK